MQSQPYILHCCWIVLLLLGAGCTSSPIVAPKPMPKVVSFKELLPKMVSFTAKSSMAAVVPTTLSTNTVMFKYATNITICNYSWVIEYKTNLNSPWLTFTNLFWDPTTNCSTLQYLMASNVHSGVFFMRSKGTPK